MVQERNAELRRGAGQLYSGLDVRAAWRRISARMIVHKDVAAGAELMGSDDDRAKWCATATDVSACDGIDREQLQLVVHVES